MKHPFHHTQGTQLGHHPPFLSRHRGSVVLLESSDPRLASYSPNLLEGVFSEVRMRGLARSAPLVARTPPERRIVGRLPRVGSVLIRLFTQRPRARQAVEKGSGQRELAT